MNYKLCEWITFFIHKTRWREWEREREQAKDGLCIRVAMAWLCLLSIYSLTQKKNCVCDVRRVFRRMTKWSSCFWATFYFTIISFSSIFSRYIQKNLPFNPAWLGLAWLINKLCTLRNFQSLNQFLFMEGDCVWFRLHLALFLRISHFFGVCVCLIRQ